MLWKTPGHDSQLSRRTHLILVWLWKKKIRIADKTLIVYSEEIKLEQEYPLVDGAHLENKVSLKATSRRMSVVFWSCAQGRVVPGAVQINSKRNFCGIQWVNQAELCKGMRWDSTQVPGPFPPPKKRVFVTRMLASFAPSQGVSQQFVLYLILPVCKVNLITWWVVGDVGARRVCGSCCW